MDTALWSRVSIWGILFSQLSREGVVRNEASRRQKSISIAAHAAFAAAYFTCGMITLSPTAEAQGTRYKAPSQPPAQSKAPAPVSISNGPLIAVVSIGRQRVTFYDKAGPVAQSPISSGARGHDTPQGVFSIIEKKEEHFSNLYNDAAMPYMQRITWSGVAMHAGALPGYPASHGCIRLPYSFAQNLFKLTKLNTRVVVLQEDTAPSPISHPALFQPKLAEAPVAAAKPEPSAPARSLPPLKTEDGETPMMLGGRLAKPSVADATDSGLKPQKAVITPLEAARAQKLAAANKAIVAAKTADATKLMHKASLAELGKAQRSVGPTDYAAKRTEARAAQIEKLIALAKTEELVEKATAAHAKAIEEAATAVKIAADAKVNLAERQKGVKESLANALAAEKARVAAIVEAKVSERLTEPVSVFVSRKMGKLYIRQGRIAVMEVPVTIKDAQKPIGTHIFTAMDSKDGGLSVLWNVINVQGVAPEAPIQNAKGKSQQPQQRPATPTPVSLASAALERVEFPEAAVARITPYLQLGSSLLISDLGPSVETGPGTDFVVQTRGEQEAILSIQKFVRERGIKTARNN